MIPAADELGLDVGKYAQSEGRTLTPLTVILRDDDAAGNDRGDGRGLLGVVVGPGRSPADH
jgi:hypothetical protein